MELEGSEFRVKGHGFISCVGHSDVTGQRREERSTENTRNLVTRTENK